MKEYLKSKKYDPDWVSENWMGPNPLWLVEELCENLDLRPKMKVLDMGCGRGITSVFLAKEFGVTVFANDLWISAAENLRRFREAGVEELVFPFNGEAHALPYAEDFFDAAISIDSYQYYGADEMYFPCTFSKLVKKGGQFGIVVPGLTDEFPNGYPETLKEYWIGEMFSFHSANWWRHLWEKTGIAEIKACYNMEGPKQIWLGWAEWAKKNRGFNDLEFLSSDTNNDLALIVLSAVKNENI